MIWTISKDRSSSRHKKMQFCIACEKHIWYRGAGCGTLGKISIDTQIKQIMCIDFSLNQNVYALTKRPINQSFVFRKKKDI